MSYYNNIYDYLNAYEMAQQQQQQRTASAAASRRRRQHQQQRAPYQYGGGSFYVAPPFSPFFSNAVPAAANKRRTYAAAPPQPHNYHPLMYDFGTSSNVNDVSEEDGNDEQVYTLEDILNLVNRHRLNNPEQYGSFPISDEKTEEEQAVADEEAKEVAAEAAKEAAAIGAVREAAAEEQEAQEKAHKEAAEKEDEQGRVFDIADLIREAILAAQQEDEEEEEEAKGEKKSETHAPEVAKDDTSAASKAPVSNEDAAATFHLSAPSPVHDPLQVSQPQLSAELPFSPQVDVYVKPDALYKVVLSLPGANKNSFEIDFHPSNQELFIKGSTCNKDKLLSSSEDDDLKYLKVSEINFGAFQRSIKFPSLPKVKDEEIKAKYSNGLLEIIVPVVKPEPTAVKPKKRVVVEEVEDEELKYEKGH